MDLRTLLGLTLLLLPLARSQSGEAGEDSAVVVCDAITCEMDCRKKTQKCGVYGCNGVCIGYACSCFTKPRPPPGGWKEYNPLDTDDGTSDNTVQQQQQQQPQPQPQPQPQTPPQPQQPQSAQQPLVIPVSPLPQQQTQQHDQQLQLQQQQQQIYIQQQQQQQQQQMQLQPGMQTVQWQQMQGLMQIQ